MTLLLDLWHQGHTIVMITHDPAVARHRRRIILLKDGMIENDGLGHNGHNGDD